MVRGRRPGAKTRGEQEGEHHFKKELAKATFVFECALELVEELDVPSSNELQVAQDAL
jgi:hypothetical protein